MKRIKISVLSLLLVGGLFSNNASAQEKVGGLYVDVNLGYNFSAGNQDFGESRSYVKKSDGNSTTTNTFVEGSLGKGMRFGANVGYLFNANIGAELGMNYLLGGTTSIDGANSSAEIGSEYKNTSKEEFSASMFQFNPSIVLTTGAEGFTPYAKLGLVIGVASQITYSEERTGTTLLGPVIVPNNQSIEQEANGGIALGWSAALGAKYALNDHISLFGELNLINMAYAPTKGEYNKYTVNGIDQLTGASIGFKEFEFVDEVTYSNLSTTDETKPTQQLKQNFSFSSVGIQVGLHIAF
jgi:opacity protein-like surface antigen